MKPYSEFTKEELLAEKQSLEEAYKEFQKRKLTLNMARGKPSKEQLNLSLEMLTDVNQDTDMIIEDGVDVRNYGVIDGIYGAKQIIATMAKSEAEHVIVFGNSSLNVMFDTVARGMISGYGGNTPWYEIKDRKWLCPVPGYDRHFTITEFFGFEMINIPMNDEGPDMDMVEDLVSKDPSIKGIWCTPKYSNPSGIVYSVETVKRFANLSPAAPDFRIFWDNAYAIHDLYEEIALADIFGYAIPKGKQDMIYEFVSTSKVSFPGSGIAGIIASQKNLDEIRAAMAAQTIGHDKINQLRHALFFDNGRHLADHMKKHAEIIRPKFEKVEETLDTELEGLGCGTYTKPRGGYFITYVTNPGCARRVIELAKEAGMTMTGAGAPFPHKNDPEDSTIRIAPTFPNLEEIGVASELFTLCVKLATVEKLLK